jgi:hypothetical protein
MSLNIQNYIEDKYLELLNSKVIRCELTLEWKNSFDNGTGVDVIKIKDEIIYAGETSNLRKRMNDMRNTMHHVVRRNIGNERFANEEGFQVASAKRRFTDVIENKLEKFMIDNLLIFTLPLELGRKELEEYIIEVNNKPRYNVKGNNRLNSRNNK